MRATAFAASLLLITNLTWGQPSSLNTLEQGLQSPAAPGTAPAAGGYLGAELEDAGDNRGVRVQSVKPGTPAEASGLKGNDLIVSIDGKKIANLDEYDIVAKRPSGAKMVFMVDRGGRQQPLAVTLGTKSNTAGVSDQGPPELQPGAPSLTAPGAAPSNPSLLPPASTSPSTLPAPLPSESSPRSGGITAQPLDTRPPTSDSFTPSGVPGAPGASGISGSGKASLGITVDSARQSPSRAARRGAYIADVKAGSPAAIAGLPVGGVIVQVDGQKVNSDDDLINFIRAARPSQEVELTYYDGADRLGKKMVRLAEAGAPPASNTFPGAGGFTAPGSIPAPSEPSARPGIGGSGRPLINRIEQMTENFGRGTGPVPGGAPLKTTTVYDPLAMAALQRTVQELASTVNSLEERIRALEGKAGITSPPAGAAGGTSSPFGPPSSTGGSSSFGSPQTPGFGSPSPSITPGFGPPGTNP